MDYDIAIIGGVSFFLNTKIVEIGKSEITIEKDGKLSAIEAEKILVCVGRKAALSTIGLDKLNLELLKNGLKVNADVEPKRQHI